MAIPVNRIQDLMDTSTQGEWKLSGSAYHKTIVMWDDTRKEYYEIARGVATPNALYITTIHNSMVEMLQELQTLKETVAEAVEVANSTEWYFYGKKWQKVLDSLR